MDSYLVWCPDHLEGPEDGRTIKAVSGEDAAETWADIDDQESAEYSIVQGASVTVVVRESTNGTEERYKIYGESVPSYRAVIEGGNDNG